MNTKTKTTLEDLTDAKLQTLSKEELVHRLVQSMTTMEMISFVEDDTHDQ